VRSIPSVARGVAAAGECRWQLGSLIAERELVSRLSTWRWQAGTVGAVASAIILPVVITLITRLLGRIV
jgi:hypothetical protein